MLWQLSTLEWIVSLSFFSAMAYISGWIADRIMAKAGFGHVGNWLLLLAGAYVGMYAYNFYGYDLNWYPLYSLTVILGSATVLLVFMSILKRVVFT